MATQSGPSKTYLEVNDPTLVLLDALNEDLKYLHRHGFEVAVYQMISIMQSEAISTRPEVQEKLVRNMESAKDSLSEEGASTNAFVKCPQHLETHRVGYSNMLLAAKSILPMVQKPDVKLRLRRLLLPLTSSSRFRFSPTGNAKSAKTLSPPPPLALSSEFHSATQYSPSEASIVLDPSTERFSLNSNDLGSPFGQMNQSAAWATDICDWKTFPSPPVSVPGSASVQRKAQSSPSRNAIEAPSQRMVPYPGANVIGSHRMKEAGDNRTPDATDSSSRSATDGHPSSETPVFAYMVSPPQSSIGPLETSEEVDLTVVVPKLSPVSFVSSRSPSAMELMKRRQPQVPVATNPAAEVVDVPVPIPNLVQESWSPNSITSVEEPADNKEDPFVGGGYHGITAEQMDEADLSFRMGYGWRPFQPLDLPRDLASEGGDPELPSGMTWAKSWLDAPKIPEGGIDMSRLGSLTEDELRRCGGVQVEPTPIPPEIANLPF